MKKIAVVVLPLLLAGGLLVKVGFARFPGKPYLIGQCDAVATEIEAASYGSCHKPTL